MKGLYKNDNGQLLYAANVVYYPDGTQLIVADYEGNNSEIQDGWYWFETRQEALDYFGITEPIVDNFFSSTEN